MLKLNCLGLLSPLMKFEATEKAYLSVCSRMHQHNFDYILVSNKSHMSVKTEKTINSIVLDFCTFKFRKPSEGKL